MIRSVALFLCGSWASCQQISRVLTALPTNCLRFSQQWQQHSRLLHRIDLSLAINEAQMKFPTLCRPRLDRKIHLSPLIGVANSRIVLCKRCKVTGRATSQLHSQAADLRLL